jgi:TolB-like protein
MLTLGVGIPIHGIDIVVIPVVYYEKRDDTYVMREAPNDITGYIIEWLEKYYNIQRDKTELNDRLAGATDADARRVADIYHVEYVLYGSVREDSGALTAELKIYNARLEKYELFYARDAKDRYERLIDSLCEHILEWYHTERDKLDVMRNEIEGLRETIRDMQAESEKKEKSQENVLVPEVEKEFGLKIPVRAGYWSYMDRQWTGLVQGTAEGSFGVEIFPRMQFPTINGMRNEIFWGMQFGYRYGMTAKKQKVQVHDIIINPLVGYHLNFYDNNWATLGLGMFFQWGIWKVGTDGYVQPEKYSQAYTGVSLLADYSYRFNKFIAVNLGADFYFYFVSGTPVVINSFIGMVITVVGGNYEK